MQNLQWLQMFTLYRQNRFLYCKEMETLPRELASEIIHIILFNSNHHMGDMLREKLKYKDEAEVIKKHLVSSAGVKSFQHY